GRQCVLGGLKSVPGARELALGRFLPIRLGLRIVDDATEPVNLRLCRVVGFLSGLPLRLRRFEGGVLSYPLLGRQVTDPLRQPVHLGLSVDTRLGFGASRGRVLLSRGRGGNTYKRDGCNRRNSVVAHNPVSV